MSGSDHWTGDTGLARERSDLSWGRSLLAIMTVTGLFLRWLPIHGAAVILPTALGVLAGVGLMQLRHGRRREIFGRGGDAVTEVIGLTVLVLLVGASAVALIVAGLRG